MSRLNQLEALIDAGALAHIDHYFARLVTDLGADQDTALAAAITSAIHRAGHTCLELGNCGRRIVDLLERPDSAPRGPLSGELEEARLPDRQRLANALAASPVVGAAGAERPLILDGERLYLHRLFEGERRLAEKMLRLAGSHPAGTATEPAVDRVFAEEEDRTAEAEAAIRAALERRLCIVTGGPGTGKTTLAAKLIAVLVASGVAEPRRIGLAAPTGKASSRLQESVRAKLREEPLNRVGRLEDFPAEATTVHRLLADRNEPLARLQLLIVDECSMADLQTMVRLMEALPDSCHVILLGDANQLSSVEPGSVFSDLCLAGASGALAGCVARLTKNYRFRMDSRIGQLAASVVAGDADGALNTLGETRAAETGLRQLEDEAAFADFARDRANEWAEHIAKLKERPRSSSPFPARRVLCSHRRGPFGTGRFNRLVERRLAEKGHRIETNPFYVGRPIIVSRNDRQTGLMNGDTGVVLADEGGNRKVWFPDLDHDGEPFEVSPSRLPEHESFFALTVHRAQGSEYEEVVLVLGDAASRVNTRELLYTAVTRARNRVTVMATGNAVRAAVMRTTSRATGLLDRLR